MKTLRWDLFYEIQHMETVADERTARLEARRNKWLLRTYPWLLLAVLDWRALHGGSFLLTGKKVTAWNGLSRTVLGGIWAGSALYYLLGARSLLTALGAAVLGCGLYGAYLALAQTHVMNRAKQEDPEGWWPNEHPGRGLAVLLALAAAGLAMMAAGWNFG